MDNPIEARLPGRMSLAARRTRAVTSKSCHQCRGATRWVVGRRPHRSRSGGTASGWHDAPANVRFSRARTAATGRSGCPVDAALTTAFSLRPFVCQEADLGNDWSEGGADVARRRACSAKKKPKLTFEVRRCRPVRKAARAAAAKRIEVAQPTCCGISDFPETVVQSAAESSRSTLELSGRSRLAAQGTIVRRPKRPAGGGPIERRVRPQSRRCPHA